MVYKMKKISLWIIGIVAVIMLGLLVLFGPFIVSLFVNTLPVGSSLPTVDGPESTRLLNATTGYLLEELPRGGIKAIALPSLETIVIREPITDYENYEPVHSLSGPDRDGRIAYVSYNPDVLNKGRPRHFLKVTSIRKENREVVNSHPVGVISNHTIGDDLAMSSSGRDPLRLTLMNGKDGETIFSRPGDALWDNVIGHDLALSPVGGYVAFVGPMRGGKLEDVQMYNPKVFLHEGYLEIWNITQIRNLRNLQRLL